MNALLMDNLQGVRQIKAFGREVHEDTRFALRADDLRLGTLKVMLAWANYSPAMSFATAIGTVLVLWIGGAQVLAGPLKPGELVTFLLYLGLFYEPVGRLHGLNQMLQAARAAGLDVRAVVLTPWPQRPSQMERSNRETIARLGDVEVEVLGRVHQPDRADLGRVGAGLPWRRWIYSAAPTAVPRG